MKYSYSSEELIFIRSLNKHLLSDSMCLAQCGSLGHENKWQSLLSMDIIGQ